MSPFAIQKGLEAIAGVLQSTTEEIEGWVLPDEMQSEAASGETTKTKTCVDRPVYVTVRKWLNFSRGKI